MGVQTQTHTIKEYTYLKSAFKRLSFGTILLGWDHFKILAAGTPPHKYIWTSLTSALIGVKTSFDRQIKGSLSQYKYITFHPLKIHWPPLIVS